MVKTSQFFPKIIDLGNKWQISLIFYQRVQTVTGHAAVRTAENLEGGALTYAEIKAVGSGNAAVMATVHARWK